MWVFLDQTHGHVCGGKVRKDSVARPCHNTPPLRLLPKELWLDRPLEAGERRAANLSAKDLSVVTEEMKHYPKSHTKSDILPPTQFFPVICLPLCSLK